MTRENIMAVNVIIIEWLMGEGYYVPSDSNEPVKLLVDMTDFIIEKIGQPNLTTGGTVQ